MNTRLLPLCAVLIAALRLAASAQTTPVPTSPPVTLRYKWMPGEVLHYQMTLDNSMTMTMSGRGPNAPHAMPALAHHMVMAYSLAVQSINPDGSATLTEHITQLTAMLNGRHIPGLDAAANAYKGGFTIVMSPTGKMLSVQMPPAIAGKRPPGMDFSKLGSMVPTTLPPSPVQVGDTWQGYADLSRLFDQIPGMPILQMTVFSSLAGLSKDAHPIADIRQTYQGALGGAAPAGAAGKVNMAGQLHGDTLLKFDVDNGSVAGQDGTFALSTSVVLPKMPTSSVPQTMRIRMQMTTHLERLPGTS